MTTNQILLRNTVSRVTASFEENYARRLLADPHYGKILVEVDSDKPEVLGQPQIDGKPIDDAADQAPGAQADGDAVDANLGGEAEATVIETKKKED